MTILKPGQRCACCKRVIDQDGHEKDRSLRLGSLDEGTAFCRRCSGDAEFRYRPDPASRWV